MYERVVCVYECVPHAYSVGRGQKRVSDSLYLQLVADLGALGEQQGLSNMGPCFLALHLHLCHDFKVVALLSS